MGRSRVSTWLTVGVLTLAALALWPGDAAAKSAEEIDAAVDATLELARTKYSAAVPLLDAAKGVLVFPSIVSGAVIIGGAYGEGALRIGGRTVDYYASAAGSIGLQLGGQKRTDIILFMTDEALADFQASSGWEAGVDGTITVVELGASGSLDTTTATDPIIGVTFGEKGLMAGVSLRGAKFTKLVR